MSSAPSDRTSVIVAGARTPMGRLLGSLKGFSAAELGAVAIKGRWSAPGSRRTPSSTSSSATCCRRAPVRTRPARRPRRPASR
jgi:hypothetical protein